MTHFLPKIYFSLIRVLKSKKKKLALTLFYCLDQETWLDDSWKLIQFYNFLHVGNSKMFNITSKYFSIFSNKPPANWVAPITKDFHTCYSSSYYSSMPLFSHSCYFLFKKEYLISFFCIIPSKPSNKKSLSWFCICSVLFFCISYYVNVLLVFFVHYLKEKNDFFVKIDQIKVKFLILGKIFT